MAGYSENREQNYEIKYLRKVLGQVDNRIRVPQSVDAKSLRGLLDDVEPATPRDLARRRPRWLSLQSGIAYAAAFALIVALFYSMEMYKPAMIDGVMPIAQSTSSAQETPRAAGESAGIEQPETKLFDAGQAPANTEDMPQAAAFAEDATDSPAAAAFGIGGTESTLLLEQDDYAYYWRANDANDPDRAGFPITLEITAQSTGQLVTQINIPDMYGVSSCFVSDGKILLVGDGSGGLIIRVYDADPSDPAERLAIAQLGAFVDARLYKNIVYIASLSDTATDDAVELPQASADDCCVITAVDLTTFETAQKGFIGARGDIQLHNLNAYIHYEGIDDDGNEKHYIGQVLLDGTDIELGPVS